MNSITFSSCRESHNIQRSILLKNVVMPHATKIVQLSFYKSTHCLYTLHIKLYVFIHFLLNFLFSYFDHKWPCMILNMHSKSIWISINYSLINAVYATILQMMHREYLEWPQGFWHYILRCTIQSSNCKSCNRLLTYLQRRHSRSPTMASVDNG